MVPIHVINLDRVPRRWTFVHDQFVAAGLGQAVHRFSAVDARAPDFVAPGYAPHSWGDRWELELGEQAIFESHRAAWHLVRDQAPHGAVICEDDILVSGEFAKVLEALPDADLGLVKLDGFNSVRRYGPLQKIGSLCVRQILEPVPSAACYFVNRSSADRLIEESRAYCATLDDYLFAPRAGLPPVQLFPAVAVQGMCCASLEGAGLPDWIGQSERADAHSARRAGKGPTAYRAGKELSRLARRMGRAAGADRRLLDRGGLIDCPHLAPDLPPYRVGEGAPE